MDPNKLERFEQYQKDEDKYWDAMNDQSWQRAGQIQKSMDRDIENNVRVREEYQQWKRRNDLREAEIAAINKKYGY